MTGIIYDTKGSNLVNLAMLFPVFVFLFTVILSNICSQQLYYSYIASDITLLAYFYNSLVSFEIFIIVFHIVFFNKIIPFCVLTFSTVECWLLYSFVIILFISCKFICLIHSYFCFSFNWRWNQGIIRWNRSK